jgi:hypothetical protein
MRINKHSILTLFATGLTLGSLASGVSAFADDNSGYTGSNFETNTSSMGLGSISQSDSKGSVSGKSDAHIQITNGYLVLEAVPSLGFQAVTAHPHDTVSNKVIDHSNVLDTDSLFGNDQNKELSVQDARNNGSTNESQAGYSVTASLGDFGTYADNGKWTKLSDNTKSIMGSEQFQLNLTGKLDTHSSIGNTLVANNQVLTAGNGNSLSVLSNDTNGSGRAQESFDKSTLTVPENMPAGNYAASITWTLSPNANPNVANATQNNSSSQAGK